MLIVGLGNIGSQYAQTRHNIGKWAVLQYCQENNIDLSINKKLKAMVGKKAGHVFAIPLLYMNESGLAVSLCANWFDIDPEEIVVVHDEFDLDVGDIRRKTGGGSAGHNGIKSVENHLKTREFNRIRIGIGKPPYSTQGADYALKELGSNKWADLCEESQKALDLIDDLV
jgi:PTH1 family peptidyl-tRNA hydrolase